MEKEQLHKCPRCGNLTTLILDHEIEIEEDFYIENAPAIFGFNNYYIFSCISCCRVSIFANFFTNPVKQKISELDLIYPVIKNVPYFLPEAVKQSYAEAKKVQKISAVSFAILIRKSLELICKDQRAKGTNLSEMIKDLSKQGVLPKKIIELATLIRHLGNVSAHDTDPVDFWDVDLLDELFHFITDYIYVIDNRIETLKGKWGMSKAIRNHYSLFNSETNNNDIQN